MRVATIICSVSLCACAHALSAHAADAKSVICGTTAYYRERAMAVQRLGTTLGTNEITSLYAFLAAHVSAQPRLSAQEQASLKNAIADVLVAQKQLPADLGEQLLTNYRDATHDAKWRLHCLTQMGAFWGQAVKLGGGEEGKLGGWDVGKLGSSMEEILGEVRAAAAGTNDEFACVGLIVLGKIGAGNDRVSAEEAVALAVQHATNTTRGAGLRATAIGMAAKAGKTEILAAARVAAQDESKPGLQHAAVTALGLIGTASDKAMVQGLAQGGNKGTAAAAQEALRRFAARGL